VGDIVRNYTGPSSEQQNNRAKEPDIVVATYSLGYNFWVGSGQLVAKFLK
jgi:hypothetical protein